MSKRRALRPMRPRHEFTDLIAESPRPTAAQWVVHAETTVSSIFFAVLAQQVGHCQPIVH